MKQILFLLLVILLISGCNAQHTSLPANKDNNTLLWEISGNHLSKPSYLFGTFHLMCKADIKFSEALKSAIQKADTVYMELDMDNPSTMAAGIVFMNMKDKKTLKDLYTPEQYAKLEKYFADSLHIGLVMFNRAKPYFLTSLFFPTYLNCSDATSIEQELVTICRKEKKAINGLETVRYQTSLFDSIPYEWQAKELLKSIDSSAQMKIDFQKMTQLYREQKLDSLTKLINQNEYNDNRFMDLLLNNRNKNWVSQLEKLMKNESLFVAVGAGHLPGEMGLINLLRKAGYTVTPLKN